VVYCIVRRSALWLELQCVAMCCSVLQCAVCESVLQCVVVCCSVLCVKVRSGLSLCVLQCAAACCVLKFVQTLSFTARRDPI